MSQPAATDLYISLGKTLRFSITRGGWNSREEITTRGRSRGPEQNMTEQTGPLMVLIKKENSEGEETQATGCLHMKYDVVLYRAAVFQ